MVHLRSALASLAMLATLALFSAACGDASDPSAGATPGRGDRGDVTAPGGDVTPGTKPGDPPPIVPTDPGTEPTDPGTEPTDPGTEPTDPGTEPTDPGTEPTDPGTEPTDPGTPGVDGFGVTMIYPSVPGGEAWFLSDDPGSDDRFDPQDTITRNADGSWKMKETQVRMNVFTSTGYDTSKIETQNRDQLVAKGYMQAPNDWKNVEMTGFVKVNAAADMADNFAWYARGGRHNDALACEGAAYKGDLHYDGRTRWAKESWHVSYDYRPYATATTSLKGRWVGWKVVMRNLEQDGQTVVKLESYLNDDGEGKTWEKVYEWVDDGTWAGDHAHCGASNTKVAMTWGGPTATFRWDSATDVDFKWLSVREIQP